jgi:hypothetical protein
MLRGKKENYSWETALELLSKPAKLCDECYYFNILEIEKSKLDFILEEIKPKIDSFDLDEQALYTQSEVLFLMVTWMRSVLESYECNFTSKKE